MSKQTKTFTRRDFLKGAAYTSVLSIGGLSGAALANSANLQQPIVSETTSAAVTLFNQSVKTVALDAKQPISLEKINGWVVVKVNKAANSGSAQILNLEAGQKLSLAVDTEVASMSTGNHRHPAINRTVFVGDDDFPACLYDSLAA